MKPSLLAAGALLSALMNIAFCVFAGMIAWTPIQGRMVPVLLGHQLGPCDMVYGLERAKGLVSLALWILPVLWVWRRFRPNKAKIGECRCGYNLTGNTSGVCPECGISLRSPEGQSSQGNGKAGQSGSGLGTDKGA